MFKTKKRLFILGTVLLLAFFLRTFHLATLPDGFQGDEAAFGYNAFSIGKTGQDEYGKSFPLYFASIGDYKYPAYVYLSVPLVKIFGLTEFSTRLLSAISGTLAVLLIFFLVHKLTKNYWLALSTGLTLTFSPWHIFFSRGAFEAVLGLTLTLGTLYFFLEYFFNTKKTLHKKSQIILIFIFFIGAIFSYSPYRIFLPLLLFALTPVGVITHKIKTSAIKWAYVLIVVLGLISFLSSLNPESRVRAGGLLNGTTQFLNVDNQELQLEDGFAHPGETFATRLFHNKIITQTFNYIASYINHFNPDFLFINGDKTRQMYNIPNVGLLYLFDLPLLILGFIFLSKKHGVLLAMLICWLFLGTIPSAIVNEQPSSIRFLLTVPVFTTLSGAGLYYLVTTLKQGKKILFLLPIAIIILFNLLYVHHQYTIHSVYYRHWTSDVGMKELVTQVTKLESNYSHIVLPNDPYIFFLFYNKILPTAFLQDSVISPGGIGTWERVDSLGKLVFKMPLDCPKVGRLHVLYVCKGGEIPQNSKLIHHIPFKDNATAFSLIEFYPLSQPILKTPLPSRLFYMTDVDHTNDGLIPDTQDRFW